MKISIIPVTEFSRLPSAVPLPERLQLIADMCRLNTLSIVKLAGSGHLGSSFSAMDLVVWLYYSRMNTVKAGFQSADRDIYFSSKGHDVPGQYAVLHSLGVISEERFLRLRRWRGLDGHPDVGVPGIECNSGSLGMGISKGKGIAWAKQHRGLGGQVYVLTGMASYKKAKTSKHCKARFITKSISLSLLITISSKRIVSSQTLLIWETCSGSSKLLAGT